MELCELKNNYKIPNHICFIVDGNGRWAKLRNLPRKEGHKKGYEVLTKMYDYVREIGIKHVSIYAFSTENWKRPDDEVQGLMKMFRTAIKDFGKKRYQDCKIEFWGDLSRFDKDIREGATKIMEDTKDNDNFHINVCMNYGGREDIVQAVNALIKEGKKEVTAEDISSHLYTKSSIDPDFIVRTSGAMRLSNFLPWQSTYAELYFPKVLWPDFSKEDLIEAIKEYSSRDRRFGGV